MLIPYFIECMADDHEQADGAIKQPGAGDGAINGLCSVLVVSEIADVAAFDFIDSQQKEDEDDRVDERFLELHDIGFSGCKIVFFLLAYGGIAKTNFPGSASKIIA